VYNVYTARSQQRECFLKKEKAIIVRVDRDFKVAFKKTLRDYNKKTNENLTISDIVKSALLKFMYKNKGPNAESLKALKEALAFKNSKNTTT
jgi:hypothetical protein